MLNPAPVYSVHLRKATFSESGGISTAKIESSGRARAQKQHAEHRGASSQNNEGLQQSGSLSLGMWLLVPAETGGSKKKYSPKKEKNELGKAQLARHWGESLNNQCLQSANQRRVKERRRG